MDTKSLWKTISTLPVTYPSLSQNIDDADVAIIGGGITGVTAAYPLVNAGKKVVILEADTIGGVTTACSTGNLYIPVQPFFQIIAEKFSFETAKIIAHSRKFAVDYIENNIREQNIKCNFARRPWYGYTANHARISLDKEVELFKKMEIPIDYVNDLPLNFKFSKAICIRDQARFNPLQYVISMADNLAKRGCLIFEKTRVIQLSEDSKEGSCLLQTESAKVTAKKVLMATHTPIGINLTQMYTAPYRSYVVSVRLKNNQYPEGHFWDLDRPPHATCTHAERTDTPELLMVAGSHHKVGQSKDTLAHYKELEKFLRDHFAVEEVAYQWSAQHYKTADTVPYIGLASSKAKHTYMATGYFADGLVYGTLAGIIVSDLMLGNKNPLVDVYNANRYDPMASIAFVAKENANILMQYLQDYPYLTSNQKYDDIKAGEGKIVEINREKCGVSRDHNNKLHIVSAVCTHMKCIVNWNTAERTWDCPCHGSRFTQEGKVIEGPALMDLESKQ